MGEPSAPNISRRCYSFGEFTLDLERGALLRAGADVDLRPKSFEVLRVLVERHGRLVTKQELLDAVWGRVVVTEGSVAKCLIEIRRAIDDRSQRSIRTVPRRGYIFDAPVTATRAPIAEQTVATQRPRVTPVRRAWIFGAALAVAVTIAARGPSLRCAEPSRRWALPKPSKRERRRLPCCRSST